MHSWWKWSLTTELVQQNLQIWGEKSWSVSVLDSSGHTKTTRNSVCLWSSYLSQMSGWIFTVCQPITPCPKEQATEHLWDSVFFSVQWILLANFRVMVGQVLDEITGVDCTCPGGSVRQTMWGGRVWVCKAGPKELTSLFSGNRQQHAPSSGWNTKCPLYTLLVSWASTLHCEIHILRINGMC